MNKIRVNKEEEGNGIGSRVCTILGHFRKPAFALLPLIPQATPTNLSTEAGDPSAIQIKAIQADRHQKRNRFFDQTALGRGSRSTAYHTCWKEREVKVSEEYPVIVPGKDRPLRVLRQGSMERGL